jgi:hypothetical protein
MAKSIHQEGKCHAVTKRNTQTKRKRQAEHIEEGYEKRGTPRTRQSGAPGRL